jgi:hypothetical protein
MKSLGVHGHLFIVVNQKSIKVSTNDLLEKQLIEKVHVKPIPAQTNDVSIPNYMCQLPTTFLPQRSHCFAKTTASNSMVVI